MEKQQVQWMKYNNKYYPLSENAHWAYFVEYEGKDLKEMQDYYMRVWDPRTHAHLSFPCTLMEVEVFEHEGEEDDEPVRSKTYDVYVNTSKEIKEMIKPVIVSEKGEFLRFQFEAARTVREQITEQVYFRPRDPEYGEFEGGPGYIKQLGEFEKKVEETKRIKITSD